MSKIAKSSNSDLSSTGIFEINAYQALMRFERFIEGATDDILLVVSSSSLDEESREAIRSSADKLGYGSARISWAVILGRPVQVGDASQVEPVPLSPENMHLLIESIDPVAVIATDIGAMSVLSEAYGVSLDADSANRVACRSCAAFSDFSAMMGSSDSKQKAWHVLKNLSPVL